MESIELSNNLEYLGKVAFWYTPVLESVSLPQSLRTVETMAFGHNYGEDCILTIYSAHSYKPSGWAYDWNPRNIDVVWGDLIYLDTKQGTSHCGFEGDILTYDVDKYKLKGFDYYYYAKTKTGYWNKTLISTGWTFD